MRTQLRGVAALAAVVVLPGCSAETASAPTPPFFEPLPVSVEAGDVFPLQIAYSGWWSTPASSPGTVGSPVRVGLIRAGTGRFLAGYDRAAGRQVTGADVDPQDGWPPGAVLAVDLTTGVVWDWFIVNSDGSPAPGFRDEVSAERRYPPIAGRLPPGTFHTFMRDVDSGLVIYLGTSAEDLPDNTSIGLDW